MSVPLVVLGASLGGLAALTTLLRGLPATFPAAIALVQHRRADSDSRMAELLNSKVPMQVSEAEDKEPVRSGRVYVAPADYHLLIDEDRFALNVDPPHLWARPAIDVLFESAAESGARRLAAVLLTAASEDGAAGIAAVARKGGLTIVQDPDEAASDVAPRAAIERTPVDYVLPVASIAPRLVAHFRS